MKPSRTCDRLWPAVVAAIVLWSATGAVARAVPWTIEPLATTGNLGWSIDIDRAPDGTLYVSSYRQDSTLLVMKRQGGAWSSLPSLPIGDYSTALDAGGRPHVLTHRAQSSVFRLEFSRLNDSNTWETTVIHTGGQMRARSLVFDSQNRPHVAFIDNVDRTLKHVCG
ncbi:MAG: hypothetical protein HY718_19670 [Planctomycetes bacterium]|nr:hypothetical protein [Planctomycetota bacterium]